MAHYLDQRNDADAFRPGFSAIQVPTAMDEGYSEETRSQADNDSAMGIEQEMSMPIMVDGLRDGFLNFSEAEKSGKCALWRWED